ncbi:hypothetical protein KP509_33G013200 [Ceratopteris richardii]|uniref:Reverse transcriptase domain-containing protein n=1 Tax=Ceratopteris richardii TaxID=49495 RepID=A0A8T2QM64_CERRI|nr:hypothetical protein KP509_33G013200 [Ceratopteris richardii]
MSRLDRCCYSHVYTLNLASSIWIDATMLLSDHNPLLINFRDLHWESNIPNNLHKIPLRLNHAWLQTSLFKSKVDILIQQVLYLEISTCMKWEFLLAGLQEVIRECGKYFAITLTKAKVEAERMIFCITEKVDSRHLLSETEYMRLCDAYRCLHLIENNAIQSSKVRTTCTEVNDLHANSKCFFDLLRAKHLKDVITALEVDGSTLQDGNSISAICTQHFQNLFAASFKTHDAWFSSLQDALAFTPQVLDSYMADAYEKEITEEEVFKALQSLKNEKAPQIDGITKEFFIAFWPSLKTLVMDVCNEIWGDQKMPYSFKLGKIKLLPKVEVPKRMGDWRPITMMSIIYKIFANIFALRLKLIIHKVVHPSQTMFINRRSIYDNIFLTQILMEHASLSNQQIVGMQIDFEKAFDHIRWDFIVIVLKRLGFKTKFSRLIYILAQDSTSQVEINGTLSNPFPIERSVRQGCPLSPLFYALASSPNIFLRSTSIPSTRKDLKIEKGTVFHHLGYPFGLNASTKDKIEWYLSRVRCKMDLRHVVQWSMHARIRIVQAFLHPYVMYYLLLLDWKKCPSYF